jgi:ribosomal protein S25
MTLTLQEAKANGHKWAAKYAPQQPKPFVPVPFRKPPADEQKQINSMKRREKRMQQTKIRNASYFKALQAELSKTEWRRSKDIAEAIGVSIQVFLLIVRDAEKEGIVKRYKAREMVWLADPSIQVEPPVMWHNSGKERVRKPEKKRQRLDVGEASEAWRTPQ